MCRPLSTQPTLSEYRLIQDIQAVLTPDILHPVYLRQWTSHKPLYWGHCYAASEALFCMLGGKKAGYTSHCIRIDGSTHWFLRRGDAVLDPTYEQFYLNPNARVIICCTRITTAFLTRNPSKRALEIIRRVKKTRATLNRYRTVK